MNLTESHADVLAEAMNLGMGHAARALNELVGTHIQLHVPDVSMMSVLEAQERIDALGWKTLSTVQLKFEGSISGEVVLMFPHDSALKFVSLLTGDDGSSHSDIDGLRQATLEEAGNILLNGVVGALSNLFGGQVSYSIPFYRESQRVIHHSGESTQEDAHTLFADACFNVQRYKVAGEILLCFELRSLGALLEILDERLIAVE